MVSRGVDAVADHVTDHERDPRAGQRDHVVPVAAHPEFGGSVAGGDFDRGLVGQPLGEQAALQSQRDGVFAGIAAGVIDRQGSLGGEFVPEEQVVVGEGVQAGLAGDEHQTEGDPAGAQRYEHPGMQGYPSPGRPRTLSPAPRPLIPGSTTGRGSPPTTGGGVGTGVGSGSGGAGSGVVDGVGAGGVEAGSTTQPMTTPTPKSRSTHPARSTMNTATFQLRTPTSPRRRTRPGTSGEGDGQWYPFRG